MLIVSESGGAVKRPRRSGSIPLSLNWSAICHPSSVKIHLLRRESVTPIALYIARRDEQPESVDRQLEFGTVLLYREREYRSMYSSDWLVRGVRPAASPDSPFQPYDLTPEWSINAMFLTPQLITKNELACRRLDLVRVFGLT
jgi:hypothetical protein